MPCCMAFFYGWPSMGAHPVLEGIRIIRRALRKIALPRSVKKSLHSIEHSKHFIIKYQTCPTKLQLFPVMVLVLKSWKGLRVLDAAASRFNLDLNFDEFDWGSIITCATAA